jgi:hypothetical protein
MGEFQTHHTTPSGRFAQRPSQYINLKPASNLHHAIRIAEVIKRPLTLFVSINFGHIDCPLEKVPKAFQRLREKFGKWITRPPVHQRQHAVSPTFVWVLERPEGSNRIDGHWLLHVPKNRQHEFKSRLAAWLPGVVGEVTNTRAALNIQIAHTPKSALRYMLKGQRYLDAIKFQISPVKQDIIHGRRSGFTKNLGPAQKKRLRTAGLYPQARYYVPDLFK